MAEPHTDIAAMLDRINPPGVDVPGKDVPVAKIGTDNLKTLGQNLNMLFRQYRSDRRIAELRWMRNLRQYLGFYDPDLEKQLLKGRSTAYPKITRVKCISVLSRVMELMFPGNDKNWTLEASPSPDMKPNDVLEAIKEASEKDKASGIEPEMTLEYVLAAVQTLATKRADALSVLIEDQLAELGGDQSYDYVALNSEVVDSGIKYGLGVLEGPYVKPYKTTVWELNPDTKLPTPRTITAYKPMFQFLPVWDFYPDMSARTLATMDGYFVRQVLSKSQVRALADREGFNSEVIKAYMSMHTIGNYRPQEFETELRALGLKVNVNDIKTETSKYEILVWHGPITSRYLQLAGVEIPEDRLAEEIDAEVWLLDGHVISAQMNPWAEMGVDVKTYHAFLFDRDDTSVIGFGLPNVMRDTQMAVCAATRMLMDNGSVVCGPILELNTRLLRPDQDLTSLEAYKHFYRDDDGVTAQFPAVREIRVDSHLNELEAIVQLFMKFADFETFVGPATGGDMAQAPSEPMRTAVGASMLRGNASLPFKQIIRNFDRFTMSVIQSLVHFNRKFNPRLTQEAEINVIARGATSLIAKELRGMQADSLAATMRPGEAVHVDERALVTERLTVRDMGKLLLSEAEVARRQAVQAAEQKKLADGASALNEATVKKTLADAFKNIAQGQKNQSSADATVVEATLAVLEKGIQSDEPARPPAGGGQTTEGVPGGGGEPPAANGPGLAGLLAGAGQGQPVDATGLGNPGAPGQGPGLPGAVDNLNP